MDVIKQTSHLLPWGVSGHQHCVPVDEESESEDCEGGHCHNPVPGESVPLKDHARNETTARTVRYAIEPSTDAMKRGQMCNFPMSKTPLFI